MLSVQGLNVCIGKTSIVKELDINVKRGKITTLMGQSGSGKTTAALALVNLLQYHITDSQINGRVFFNGNNLLGMHPDKRRFILGRDIAIIPQSAYSGLNPFLTIRRQVYEIGQRILKDKSEILSRFHYLLELLDFEQPDSVIKSYPHQLSGGMRQRALIAMALLNRPRLLIADEPTTAVDRTNQIKVLDLFTHLCNKEDMGVLLISHDISVAARTADSITVLLAGSVMESGRVIDVLAAPRHPYTLSLLESLYHIDTKDHDVNKRHIDHTSGCPFADRCPIAQKKCMKKWPDAFITPAGGVTRCHFPDKVPSLKLTSKNAMPSDCCHGDTIINVEKISASYSSNSSLRDLFSKKSNKCIIDQLSFRLESGCCLGIVGESGAGKTTAMKAALRLLPLQNGKIIYRNKDITKLGYKDLRPIRKHLQAVFQDPDASLNPKMRIIDIILEPAKLHKVFHSTAEAEESARTLFSELELEPELFTRYPDQLSHGQKQRVAIAKALILNPNLLFADEPVSALDPFIRSKILRVFKRHLDNGMSLVLITHDLEIVKLISNHTMVLYKGAIVEFGPTNKVYNHPLHPYTKLLMSAVLTTNPVKERARRTSPKPSKITPTDEFACHYHSRCGKRDDSCKKCRLELIEEKPSHWVACKKYKK